MLVFLPAEEVSAAAQGSTLAFVTGQELGTTSLLGRLWPRDNAENKSGQNDSRRHGKNIDRLVVHMSNLLFETGILNCCKQAWLLKNSHSRGNGRNSGEMKCLEIREDRL